MNFLWKNIHILQRICSSIIYGCVFIYCIIQDQNTLFNLFIIFLLIGSLYELNKMIKKLTFIFSIILVIYIITSFFIIYKIINFENGNILILILLFHVWANDLGGYIIGKIFGRNILSTISPKKTWEGLIGSYLFCIIIGYFLQQWTVSNININWLILSTFMSISCIVGDLIISKIKRINDLKNSGIFLPGHGGFLDRLDSLLFTTFTYYLIICI